MEALKIDVKALRAAMQEIVNEELTKSGCDEQISAICEVAEAKVGMKASEIKKRGKLAFKKIYQTDKFNKEKLTAETIYDEVEGILEGK